MLEDVKRCATRRQEQLSAIVSQEGAVGQVYNGVGRLEGQLTHGDDQLLDGIGSCCLAANVFGRCVKTRSRMLFFNGKK